LLKAVAKWPEQQLNRKLRRKLYRIGRFSTKFASEVYDKDYRLEHPRDRLELEANTPGLCLRARGFPRRHRTIPPSSRSVLHFTVMAMGTTRARRAEPVVQFSIFTPNRLGRLNDLIGLLGKKGVHVIALMVLDTTDSSIIRIVVDDPDHARDLLVQEGFPFTESHLVVVEANSTDLNQLMAVLLQAELNINYLYSFIPHPNGKCLIGLSMEDNETAEHALNSHQFRTLKQTDISR
jgi:hypothetical protein